jgi:hypothetical protein
MGPKRTSVVAHPAHKATTFTFQIYIPAHLRDVYNGVLPCQPYGLSANKTAPPCRPRERVIREPKSEKKRRGQS